MLDYVLRHLGYIDADEITRQRVQDLVEQGEDYLSKYDPDIDWAAPSPFAKGLLKDYCLYAISNAADDFKVNYSAELLTLHHAYLIRKDEKEGDDTDADDVSAE